MPHTAPRITVVLATHNRANALASTLCSLAKQCDISLAWALLVVDNASTDDTASILERFVREARLPLKVMYEPRPGKARALNLALEHIYGGLVVFTDDDVFFEPGWLGAYAHAAARWPESSIFGGEISPLFPEGAPRWVQDGRIVRQSAMFARYRPQDEEGPTESVPLGPNMAIRREVIGKHRFDERLGPGGSLKLMGQETEFQIRLERLGHGPFIYTPNAKVRHSVRQEQMTVEAVWLRTHRLGRSKVFNRRERRRGPRVVGVPLRDWWSALRAGVRFAVFSRGPFALRVKYGCKWQEKSGVVRGYLDYRRGQGIPPE